MKLCDIIKRQPIDIDYELAKMVAEEIQKEIDNEILHEMMQVSSDSKNNKNKRK